jgi:hypothetical protein
MAVDWGTSSLAQKQQSEFPPVIAIDCNALCPDSGSTGRPSRIFDPGKREPIHIRRSDIELFVTAASAFFGLYDLR